MELLKQVIGKQIEVGGEKHTGWLPANSVVPPPTLVEKVAVDVRIIKGDDGFVVEWTSQNPQQSNDSWHATLAEAEGYAEREFGIEVSEWEITN